jgi:hypothetical protein
MKAECKRLFYKAWKAELPDSQPSMKFPTNFTSYKWTETRALARVFCGRSPTDSDPYNTAKASYRLPSKDRPRFFKYLKL